MDDAVYQGRTLFDSGFDSGVETGEERISQLYVKLLADGRSSDFSRAAQDKNYREALLQEYGLPGPRRSARPRHP